MVGDMSHPLSPDLHNPLSFIIMMLSLAGNLCRQDEDDRVDLGDKNSSFRQRTFLLSPDEPPQPNTDLHPRWGWGWGGGQEVLASARLSQAMLWSGLSLLL